MAAKKGKRGPTRISGDISTLEEKLLNLPVDDRIRLARALLDSFDNLSVSHLDTLWLRYVAMTIRHMDARIKDKETLPG